MVVSVIFCARFVYLADHSLNSPQHDAAVLRHYTKSLSSCCYLAPASKSDKYVILAQSVPTTGTFRFLAYLTQKTGTTAPSRVTAILRVKGSLCNLLHSSGTGTTAFLDLGRHLGQAQ